MAEVFVANIPWLATEDDLRSIFEQDFQVERAKILVDVETGKSKGYGFVTVNDSVSVEAVIEKMNGVPLQGRPIHVDRAKGVQRRQ